ncbi:hypothetical protein [Flectobacillus roseus]|uniref:hypothetical protein n=1 Tax=Flectobacillus roseus TaxID=502259 RepID=UPI0024B7DAD9|nr:hypothetical protein [Flectobacillus roseus]MDI9868234.1 hypothetical protein [Flectobacillus roseus]
MEDLELMKQELAKWADSTANLYHDLAQKKPDFDKAFYSQSNLNDLEQRPELLILAINPGSGGSYTDQVTNSLWTGWGLDGKMDGTALLKGNPTWDTRDTWPFWQRLKSILRRGEIESIIQDKSKFVLSNLTLFSSVQAKDLPKLPSECIQKTIELINILQPKKILCLGISDCIEPLKKEGKFTTEMLLPNNLLSFGKYQHIPIYSIKHPASRYNNEEMNLVGKCLKYLFDNPNNTDVRVQIEKIFSGEIEAVKNRKVTESVDKEIRIEVKEKIHERLEKEGFINYEVKNLERYSISDDIMVSVTQTGVGYVGIRHKNFSLKYTEKEYPYQEKFMDFLQKESGFINNTNDVWLGVKHFSQYGYSADQIISNIIEDIKRIKTGFEKIMRE